MVRSSYNVSMPCLDGALTRIDIALTGLAMVLPWINSLRICYGEGLRGLDGERVLINGWLWWCFSVLLRLVGSFAWGNMEVWD